VTTPIEALVPTLVSALARAPCTVFVVLVRAQIDGLAFVFLDRR
jgi:hypothetical protein